jgi:hypothetical protein
LLHREKKQAHYDAGGSHAGTEREQYDQSKSHEVHVTLECKHVASAGGHGTLGAMSLA